MIYSIIILILSLLLSLIHCFYVMNAAVLEQCSTEPITYFNKFDSNKMNCLNQLWRQVSIYLDYSCTQKRLSRKWTIKINIQKNFNWPSQIFILTDIAYVKFDKTSTTNDLIIEETDPHTIDFNNNQLTTYLWTSVSNGPQCRVKYTIVKDVCTKTTTTKAKFTDFICYYGKQNFNLITVQQRQVFDKLFNDNIKSSSNTSQNQPSNNNNNHTIIHPLPSTSNSNLSPLNANKNSFFDKYKKYIIIVGIILLIIIIIAIILIILRQNQSTNKNFNERMSDNSNVE